MASFVDDEASSAGSNPTAEVRFRDERGSVPTFPTSGIYGAYRVVLRTVPGLTIGDGGRQTVSRSGSLTL